MGAFIIGLIVALLKAFVPSLKEASRDTYTVAVPEDAGLEKRLRDRIADTWGTAMLLICFSLVLVGCGTRTVYIPDGQPVKLRETLKDVKVWIKTKDGKTEAAVMDIPEGWFAVPDKKSSVGKVKSMSEDDIKIDDAEKEAVKAKKAEDNKIKADKVLSDP